MLNRRILRIKAFKALYGYAENRSQTLSEVEARLEMSCEATRSLYLFMLAVVNALTDEAKNRIEAAQKKFNPTEEERNPNLKFVENAIASTLASDQDFKKIISKTKLSWDQYDAFLRKLYESVRSKDYYKDYMASPQRSIKEDAALFVRIFEEEFEDNADLESILEDMSILWIDDLAYALTCCCKTVQDLAQGRAWSLPPLYQSDLSRTSGLDSDKAFVTKLVRAAYLGYDKYYEKISAAVPKWDKDRLFVVDIVLIVCGLAEAQSFPEIPVKVSINEYVDISKYYSTPNSRSFVNGLLDKIIKDMMVQGEIIKSGKGLM